MTSFSPWIAFQRGRDCTCLSSSRLLAPQGYSLPNVMEILVAHIYGDFPYVPGTVVALTSTVRRAIPLFYGWGKPRHTWVVHLGQGLYPRVWAL